LKMPNIDLCTTITCSESGSSKDVATKISDTDIHGPLQTTKPLFNLNGRMLKHGQSQISKLLM
jgi:hypothetical protein